ncbi:sulfite exporter TauE/SafE family protein [uncultured Pseudokineococcus sp.]|uniref:sulfite exporter TauE/SafE family protein n=1 Tax=uncultured Pseudokineococcus sp. TaxID=1642928 RepID=UPI00262A2808|nr:sulfite exporter TauE/SafE family protein [uncultured Pseudokineococcus sp.]
MATAVLLLVAVVLGGVSQRVTGMGFALVTAPFLVLLLGPVGGVLVVNVCAALTSTLILLRVRRDVAWRRYALLGGAAVVGILPGSVLAQAAPSAWLELVVGVLVLLALASSLLARRAPAATGTAPAVVAGLAAGVMNTTAGVGGPAFSVYAVASRWPQRSFAATLQPLFITTGLVSFGSKLAIDPSSLPALAWWVWLGIAAALGVGVLLGDRVSRHLSQRTARAGLLVVAATGAATIAVRGLVELLAG